MMASCLLMGFCLALGQGGTNASEIEAAPIAIVPPTAPDRWMLMRSLQGSWEGWALDGNRLQVYGWTDMSFTASSDANSNLPMGFNYLANDFLLQQNWLRLERTVVTSATSEPTFGFRIDTILPGSDYRFTLARGIFNEQLTAHNGQPNLYGIDPIEFYVEGYFPSIGRGMDVKLGRFFSPYGVESNEAVSNTLASHSYSFIYDPFTNTGLLTTLQVTVDYAVQAGLVTGSDIFIDPAAEPTFIGSAKWAPPDGRDSVQASVIVGSGKYNQSRNFNNPDLIDVIYTHKWNARLTYNLESLYGWEWNTPQIGFANWFGVLNYLSWQFSPRVSGTTRLEFFDDAQGQRTGFPGLYAALTAGLNLKPIKDVIFRPELRYDYNFESRPFENKHGLFTATADVIVRW